MLLPSVSKLSKWHFKKGCCAWLMVPPIIRNVIRKHFTRKITLRSNSLKSFESRQNKFLKKKRLQSFVSILSPGNEPARHSRARKVKTKRKTLRALEKNISRSEAAQRQQQPCWCFLAEKESANFFSSVLGRKSTSLKKTTPGQAG